MRCFVVCSKPCTSNKHGLLSRAKVARTPVDLCGSETSKISFENNFKDACELCCSCGFEHVQSQHMQKTHTS